ncbi:helix-turn-helix domain-containing protein [Ktedonospora formicarum]|uniref:HTH araC/xylS-type domain-containing protein n=1 Tax=Ktedonospora formicarum TaxID=2778364 RepID=A0A8J3HSI2_9CHLR|nr:AraC family transcriptional regulator [Ktedonospora formicarum]GHO42456.1 hypothetical protein KSX_06190 [Ktedonospora formicarum]
MAFPGYILHEKAREYYWEGQAELSIKTFSSGRALYTLGRGFYAVDDTSYFIVNHGQPYTIAIEAETPVESFCLFFRAGFAEEVYRSLVTSTGFLLDEPEKPRTELLNFSERTYAHDQLLSSLLSRLRTMQSNLYYEAAPLDELACEIITSVLQVRRNIFKEIEALPPLRSVTRRELYHRLYRAREYMLAFFDQPLTLDEIAHVATLSPTHFLRAFKQIFHTTPHQYLINIRLERAQRLLSQTNMPITEICFALGFESLGSFSWLFRRRIGCSPKSYRFSKR